MTELPPVRSRRPRPELVQGGRRLRDMRLAVGLTQRELADRVSVTTQTIVNWERGLTAPKPEQRAEIEAALDAFGLAAELAAPALHGARAKFMYEVIGSELRPSERLVLLVIAAWMDDATGLIPSDRLPTPADLRRATDLSSGAVTNALAVLVQGHWLVQPERGVYQVSAAP